MHSDRKKANRQVGVWEVVMRYGNMFFLQGWSDMERNSLYRLCNLSVEILKIWLYKY